MIDDESYSFSFCIASFFLLFFYITTASTSEGFSFAVLFIHLSNIQVQTNEASHPTISKFPNPLPHQLLHPLLPQLRQHPHTHQLQNPIRQMTIQIRIPPHVQNLPLYTLHPHLPLLTAEKPNEKCRRKEIEEGDGAGSFYGVDFGRCGRGGGGGGGEACIGK